ncbi:MAG: ribonuclease T [Saccharospirillaceae bacterium]|nr:ribonuclease T [Pseudomonadales bacterium]NRB79036.1 ribonuclease T [Saccharospirillaceae bacterium]
MDSDSAKTGIAYRFRGFLPIVIDVETAGFNSKTDALLEMAMQTVEMDEQGYLVPGKSISFNIEPFEGANMEKEALAFTGIDPTNPLRGAVCENDALKQMFNIISNEVKATGCTRAILVGHNATFDHSFVMAAAERCGIKRNPFHPFSTFDTSALAGLIYGQTVLKKACDEAKIEFDNSKAHNALYDTQRTCELYCKLVNRYKELGGWPILPELSR